MEPILNRDLLANNTCFGCGIENPAGLQIEVTGAPGADGALRARFIPTRDMAGFPGITHGGAIYTALDCLSTWVSTLLGPNRGAAWVLRSATALYHKPAPIGEPLTLVGRIKDHGGRWDPLTVRAEARRADGALCVEGEFKVVPLSAERLAEIAGIEQLPANWRAFLSDGA
jgi:acyl-coenzyme A thioesterase PaaI-like protein